jgi:flagellin
MAANALLQLERALDGVTTERSRFSSYINRLENVAEESSSQSTNTKRLKSQLMDADYATRTAELSKQQILQEAATAVLAQSNRMHKGMVELLN